MRSDENDDLSWYMGRNRRFETIIPVHCSRIKQSLNICERADGQNCDNPLGHT